MEKPSVKQVLSWSLYDFANSSFFTIVITFVFPAYFTAKIAPDHIVGTYWWGNTVAISALLVAIGAPIMGAVADYGGRRKIWLGLYTLIGVFATGALFFSYPLASFATSTLLTVIIANTALETGLAFYNAQLPGISPATHLGRISGWAWGLGYAGGLISLIISLIVFVQGNLFALNTENAANIRILGPFTALWILLFSLPLFLFVPDYSTKSYPIKKAIPLGLRTLKKSFQSLPKNKNLLFFFLSRIFYIDGLNTLFVFGGIYAAGTFTMNLQEVMILGIILNVTAGLGAAAFAFIDDWLGAKFTITCSLVLLVTLCSGILLITSKSLFWVLAPLIGTFVGPVQAASRSLLVRTVPKEKITEMFGFFAFSGKATNFMGPWLVALLTHFSGSQRVGMSVIALSFLIGLFTLQKVEEKKPKR